MTFPIPHDQLTGTERRKVLTTHLQLHYRLLEARTNHGLLLRLLAGSPGGSPGGSLEVTGALARLGFLPQGSIPATHGVNGSSIGARDIWLSGRRGRVVGRDEVLGEARDGGRVAGPGGESGGEGGGKGRDPAAEAGQHAGQLRSGMGRESSWRMERR